MNLTSTVIGIELGSTRIKAVLLDDTHQVLASGSYEWENQYCDGIWTYSLEDAVCGLQACYRDLKENVKKTFGETLSVTGALGISGMMHGYLPFDKDGKQLAMFRTWRNTVTGPAAEELSNRFHFNIPQRWSIAHLYQSILNGEEHVKDIARITTLAGQIHFLLSGRAVMGVGEASGMFPIDSSICDYDAAMLESFDALLDGKYPWKIRDILPKVLPAGAEAGSLTEGGALLLDPEGDLKPGIPMAPCEGDAGTGMIATNSVRTYTGNVSAGTSDFAMVVTDHMPGRHREIDMVTTPAGAAVAMIHCNNCTSDINAWVGLFGEVTEAFGLKVDKGDLFTVLFKKALEGDADCGRLMNYNYLSGEGVTDIDDGRPVFARMHECKFDLANFMRVQLQSSLATLSLGMRILDRENVRIDRLFGHGGFFKTEGVGQRLLSAAVGVPVSVMKTAGEGGPYGMALLAAYRIWKKDGESLEDYLDGKVFAGAPSTTLMAEPEEIEGYRTFLDRYEKAFAVEKAAVETL